MPLTRKQMEETILAGGSVLHGGRLHTSLATLPSKAELASTDEEKATSAAELDAQIKALQAQKDKLETSGANSSQGGGGGGDDTTEELMKHTRAQLVDKAGEANVEIGEQDTKAQIVEKILAAAKSE